jgi:hypothetical protein
MAGAVNVCHLDLHHAGRHGAIETGDYGGWLPLPWLAIRHAGRVRVHGNLDIPPYAFLSDTRLKDRLRSTVMRSARYVRVSLARWLTAALPICASPTSIVATRRRAI